VTKVADPGDGRAHRVSLTDAGRAAIDRITELRGEWLARVMADWTERQARDFLDHLTHFAHSLEAARTAERARR
jgi:DNA-binding MarR family transcriptional regulator